MDEFFCYILYTLTGCWGHIASHPFASYCAVGRLYDAHFVDYSVLAQFNVFPCFGGLCLGSIAKTVAPLLKHLSVPCSKGVVKAAA